VTYSPIASALVSLAVAAARCGQRLREDGGGFIDRGFCGGGEEGGCRDAGGGRVGLPMASCEVSADAAAALADAGLTVVGDRLRDACTSAATLTTGLSQLRHALNSAFLLFAGALVFQMQVCGADEWECVR